MSQNNDNSAAMGFAFVGAILAFALLFIFAFLAFIAFGLTILALLAWNEPFRMGKITIEPHEARAFVGRGLIGAVVLPVFVVFTSILFGVPINDDYWLYFVIGGYVGGSIGVEMLSAEDNPQNISPIVPPMPNRLPPSPDPVQRPPFQFASWDDEEEDK